MFFTTNLLEQSINPLNADIGQHHTAALEGSLNRSMVNAGVARLSIVIPVVSVEGEEMQAMLQLGCNHKSCLTCTVVFSLRHWRPTNTT